MSDNIPVREQDEIMADEQPDKKRVISDSLVPQSELITQLQEELKFLDKFTMTKYVDALFITVEEKSPLFHEILKLIPLNIKVEVVNAVKDKRTVLQRALITKNIPFVRELLEHGANIFAIPPQGNSTFHLAIYDTNMLIETINIVKELVKKGVSIPVECGKVIYYAIFEKKFECLRLLLDPSSPFLEFVNIDIMNVTPLHVSFGEGHFEAVKILIPAGADIDKSVQKDGIFPIHVSAAKGNFDSFCFLLQRILKVQEERLMSRKKYSNINYYLTLRTKESKMTPYHFAAFRGNWRVLDYMLKLSLVALDFQSSSGMTALHYGVSEAHESVVATLLSHLPNPYLEDKNGNNALVYAGFKNRYHCGCLLINYINQHRFRLTSGELKRDILLDKKIWLVLSVVDTTKVVEVPVNFKPKFDQLMIDIDHIRHELYGKSTEVESKDFKWRKFQLLHLKYIGKNEISKGSGILRDFLPNAAEVILNSDMFFSDDGGRTFGITYQETLTEEKIENMRRVGFFLALSILTNPIRFPLAPYIFKFICGEIIEELDYLGSIGDALQTIEQIPPEQIEIMDLPNTTTVHISQKATKEISFSDGFVTAENYNEYRDNVAFTHIIGGYKRELLTALSEGFYFLLPRQFLKIENDNHIVANLFTSNLISSSELMKLISEIPLEVDEWENCTSYIRCNRDTPVVQWFWEFVRKSSEETRRKIIQFATGSPMLPIGGFRYLKAEKIPFSLELISHEDDRRLPTSRTCVYTLSLPSYATQEDFEAALLYAISNCEGFHFV